MMSDKPSQPSFTCSVLFVAIIVLSGLVSNDASAAPDLIGIIAKLKHVISSSGEQLVIKVAVRNIGTDAPILPVTVALWLSDDPQLDAGDVFLFEKDVDASLLASDMSTTIKLRKPNLRGIQGKHVFITIDEGDLVAESDETNNVIVRPFGRSRCMRDVTLLEREPNETEDIAQRVGRVNPDTCVRIDGRLNQERRVNRVRVWVDGAQTLELSLTHFIQSEGIPSAVRLNLWDVDREEMVGDCGVPGSISFKHCRLDVSSERARYPRDILV